MKCGVVVSCGGDGTVRNYHESGKHQESAESKLEVLKDNICLEHWCTLCYNMNLFFSMRSRGTEARRRERATCDHNS